MKKIALIVPSSYNHKQVYKEYPLGVGYIGTVLKREGYEVKIFDQAIEGLTNNELVKKLEKYGARIIGFSIISATYTTSIELIKLIRKSVLKESFIIGGGIHVTLFPKESIKDGFDLIVKGQGESKITQIIESIYNYSKLKTIPGIVLKDDIGNLIDNEDIINCIDLDSLPIVDRSLYNIDLYTHHSIAASRGCYYRCKFCCNYSGTLLNDGVSIRSIDNVIKEIIYLQENFGAKDIFFVDDILFLKKSEIILFCKEIIKRNIKFNWYVQLRIDYIDEDVACYLKAANCKRVYFGVESGSDLILSNTNKGINRKKILNSIRCMKEVGIRVKTGWIYGLPGSLEEQKKSISLMLEARPNDISVHKLIPFPGTEYYNNSNEYGIKIDNPKDFSSFAFSGTNENINFSYMNEDEYISLLKETEDSLESAGYVSSDKANGSQEYIYTTPLNKKSISIVKNKTKG